MKKYIGYSFLLMSSFNFLSAQNNDTKLTALSKDHELQIENAEGKDLATLEREGKVLRKNNLVLYCKNGCQDFLDNDHRKVPENKEVPKTSNQQACFLVPKINEQKK